MKISTENSNRIKTISVIATFLVIALHTPTTYLPSSLSWYFKTVFEHGLCRMAVPFFFAVSGFFMVASAFALGPLSVLINAWPNRKLLNYTITMQLTDVLPTVAVCAALAAVAYTVDGLWKFVGLGYAVNGSNMLLSALPLIQGIVAAMVFFTLSHAFRLNPMGEYARMISFVIEKRMPKMRYSFI